MSNARIRNLKAAGFLCLCLALPRGAFALAETNGAAAGEAAAKAAETSASNDTLRVFLQLHEQIREAQLAIERIRHDSEAAAAKNADALAGRLENIEHSIAAQHEAMQSTGKFMLTALFIFAGLAFVGIVLTAYFQWRTVSRLVEFSGAVPATRPFGLLPVAGAAGRGEGHLVTAGPVEQSNTRLVGAIERLERRIFELEHAAHPPLAEKNGETAGEDAGVPASLSNGAAAPAVPMEAAGPEPAPDIKVLLDKGQSLLNQNKAEEAVQCFDEALAREPHNTDALVKKGTALEKLRRLQEAIECYDRAIAADGSMTIAYLYKGGLYNRMERFSEAVECYEQALRTQEKRAA